MKKYNFDELSEEAQENTIKHFLENLDFTNPINLGDVYDNALNEEVENMKKSSSWTSEAGIENIKNYKVDFLIDLSDYGQNSYARLFGDVEYKGEKFNLDKMTQNREYIEPSSLRKTNPDLYLEFSYLMREINDNLYDILENTFNNLNNKDSLAEMFMSNDYEFFEDGREFDEKIAKMEEQQFTK